MSRHISKIPGAVAVAAGAIAAAVSMQPAAAGFDNASSHQQSRYGSKVCFVDHSHYGESPSWPTKNGAVKAAIRKWEQFTMWEYGKKWGRYAMARSRSMSCESSGGRWICKTSAFPCRRR